MKEISREKIKKEICKEYKEARKFCRIVHGGTYQMMIDTDDACIWNDTFIDSNSWNEYHSKTITRLSCGGFCSSVSEKENDYVNDAIRKLNDAGWTITE